MKVIRTKGSILYCPDLTDKEIEKLLESKKENKDPRIEEYEYRDLDQREILSMLVKTETFVAYSDDYQISRTDNQRICEEIFYKYNARSGDKFLYAFKVDEGYKLFYSFPTLGTMKLDFCKRIEQDGVGKVLKELHTTRKQIDRLLRTQQMISPNFIARLRKYLYSSSRD